MTAAWIAFSALGVWIFLLLARDGFWRAAETDESVAVSPQQWPSVVAVVPARDEAEVIGESLASLLAQDYPAAFRVILVDDNSSDDTAAMARRLEHDQLTVVTGAPLPSGWTGKLWAVEQGVREAGNPDYLWLTDADIAHAPDTLRSLVARAHADKLVLNSQMARLRTESIAEKAIVPAFVWFFQMLYPFASVNNAKRVEAAAAGGCMLVRTAAFMRAGGVAAIRTALIDDCALGRLMKREGPIRLQLTHRSVSLRAYGWRDLFGMIARSAYAQLSYSPLLLAGTVAVLALLFVGPVWLTVAVPGKPGLYGAVALALQMGLYQPMLRYYDRSPLWAFGLPAIAIFYGAATVWSAIRYAQGRGGMWKGRAQAAGAAR